MTEIKKVAFVGAGLIGTGIGVNCVIHGVPVTLQTRKQVERTQKSMETGVQFFVDNGVITAEEGKKALELVTVTTSIEEAVKDADFIQESGPENLEIKRELIKTIESYAPVTALIATSSSGLRISDVFAQAEHPERCMSGHPYHPAYLLPLVEIIKAPGCTQENAEKAAAFYKHIGKEPVILKKEVVGYVANKFQDAVLREVANLVCDDVISVEDVDKALLYSVGIRWGVMGQGLCLHMGCAPEGVSIMAKKYAGGVGKPSIRLQNLAKWDTYPLEWYGKLEEGINEELADRPEEQGRDIPSIEVWRDKALLDILRIHGKI